MHRIKSRPQLDENDLKILEERVIVGYTIDVKLDPPEKLFKGIENFVAASSRWLGRTVLGRVIYEVLYLYMVQHNVIITKKGIKALHTGITTRCRGLKNPKKLLTRQEGFLVVYK